MNGREFQPKAGLRESKKRFLGNFREEGEMTELLNFPN